MIGQLKMVSLSNYNMVGLEFVTVTFIEECSEVEEFMRQFQQHCIYYKIPLKQNYNQYDVSDFLTALIKDVANPQISLNNDDSILPSTMMLINEGVPEHQAKQFGRYIARACYKRILGYFPDKTFEEISITETTVVNKYDVFFCFTNQ